MKFLVLIISVALFSCGNKENGTDKNDDNPSKKDYSVLPISDKGDSVLQYKDDTLSKVKFAGYGGYDLAKKNIDKYLETQKMGVDGLYAGIAKNKDGKQYLIVLDLQNLPAQYTTNPYKRNFAMNLLVLFDHKDITVNSSFIANSLNLVLSENKIMGIGVTGEAKSSPVIIKNNDSLNISFFDTMFPVAGLPKEFSLVKLHQKSSYLNLLKSAFTKDKQDVQNSYLFNAPEFQELMKKNGFAFPVN